MSPAEHPWWKDCVVYQIYPASFQDSNHDGIGDIRGIISRLDYIQSIGVDAIWVCPIYASPQVDNGYDISDYKLVDPRYGSLADLEDLIDEVHRRGMRILLDLVVNHTSNQHAWFKESASSKDSPKRDWYIWRPAKYDARGRRKPPNNWRSNFGGSAWQWDEATQEYYLHLFCPEQPDLNWENVETRQAIYQDAMIFWLEKGVDGFRVDTVNMYSKDPSFPDAPITDPNAEWQEAGRTYCNGPRMNEYLSEMNAILSRYDAVTVGECPHTPDRDTVIGYVSAAQKRLNMVFQFDAVDIGKGKTFQYQTVPFNYRLSELRNAIAATQSLLDGTDAWTTSFIENHDQARSVSRFGDDSPRWRVRSAKMLAMLFAMLSGTLFIYQGQEIGMINMPPDWPIEEYKDVDSTNYYNMVREQSHDDPEALAQAHASLQHLSRDHARTPMQWDESAHGGFTSSSSAVEPWMRVNTSTREINVERQLHDPKSVLAFWRQLLRLRRTQSGLFVHGTFQAVDEGNEQVFSFLKRDTQGRRRALVVCNFRGEHSEAPILRDADMKQRTLILSNVGPLGQSYETHATVLEPWEGRVYLLG